MLNRGRRVMWMVLVMISFFITTRVEAAPEVIKVLPQFLDKHGQHALSPSLYDRDAYQAILRKHPEKRSALRFAIQFKAKNSPAHPLTLRLEIRGAADAPELPPTNLVLTKKYSGWFSHWENILVPESEYAKVKEVTAWRVSLWDGSKKLNEQKSLLW